MAVISLIGIDDGALRSAVAEIVDEIDGLVSVQENAGMQADVALVLVAPTESLDERLESVRTQHPGAALVVLVPFSQPALLLRALAHGAAACHALDQPTMYLRATLRALADGRRPRAATEERT